MEMKLPIMTRRESLVAFEGEACGIDTQAFWKMVDSLTIREVD